MEKKLVGMIEKAGKVQRTIEFEYPFIEKFFVNVTYANKMILITIRDASKEVKRDGEIRFNEPKLRREYVTQIVRGWRGLTARKLQKLIVGLECEEADLDKEISFSKEVAEAIMGVSIDFEDWVIKTATNAEKYTKIEEEKNKEFENLEQ